MKISIITTVYNSKNTIREAIESVLSQNYKNIEYIIVDAGSTDGTLEIIKEYKDKISKISSESDSGIYDGLNRGVLLASGDVIGFLHANDLYENSEVIEKVVTVFKSEQADAVYGDLVYVNKENTNNIVRYWKSEKFSFSRLKYGWMPPHPIFFAKRKFYKKHSSFDTNFKISADYDFMLRVLTNSANKISYLPEVLYRMRVGGASNKSLSAILQKSKEDFKAIRRNKIGNINTLIMKNFLKIPQFFIKPRLETVREEKNKNSNPN